jgi:hypothetical protein
VATGGLDLMLPGGSHPAMQLNKVKIYERSIISFINQIK